MTDDQFRTLMDAVFKMAMRIEDIDARVKRMENMADVRHRLVAGWIAPDLGEPPAEVDMPDDVKKLLKL